MFFSGIYFFLQFVHFAVCEEIINCEDMWTIVNLFEPQSAPKVMLDASGGRWRGIATI